ncbi:MAG: VWA domain-containing protein [Oscillospiraceae bacterium]|nr:VWA domain-containing protein [Oscillospiraceae bacterium]
MKRMKRICALLLALLLGAGLTLCAFAAQKPKLDIAFVVDTSGSMEEILAEVAALLRQGVEALEASGAADIRYALIDYRDFSERTAMEIDYPYDIKLSLSGGPDDVWLALGALEAGYGGDREESVYAALIHGLSALEWREDAARLAILIGDAPALDPEAYTDYTARDASDFLQGKTIQAANLEEALAGTADIEALVKAPLAGIALPLYSLTILKPGEYDGDEGYEPFETFAGLSRESGGLAFIWEEAGALLDALLDYVAALPLPEEPEDPPPVISLRPSFTLYRKEACADFTAADAVDPARIRWESTNPRALAIDNNGQISYAFAGIGTTTIRAIDNLTGRVLGESQVKVTWKPFHWVLVIVAFGWIYL